MASYDPKSLQEEDDSTSLAPQTTCRGLGGWNFSKPQLTLFFAFF